MRQPRWRVFALYACLTGVVAPRALGQWSATLDVGSAVRRELPAEPLAYPARLDAAGALRTALGDFSATGQLFSGFRRTGRSDVLMTGDFLSAPWSRAATRVLVGGGSSGTRLTEGVRRDRTEGRFGLGVHVLGVDILASASRAWFEAGAVTPVANGTAFTLSRALNNGVITLGGQRVAYPDAEVVLRDTTYVLVGYPYHGSVERIESSWRRYGEIEGSMIYWYRGTRLDVRAGTRFASRGVTLEHWQRLTVEVPLVRRLGLVGVAGRRMSSPEQRLPAYSFASLSLRVHRGADMEQRVVSRAARRPNAPRIDVEAEALILRGLAASRVELMGDFTDWEPVSLVREPNGTWRHHVRLSSGVHHVVMRVDGGGWEPPPGLPSVADEYDQIVGLLTVTS